LENLPFSGQAIFWILVWVHPLDEDIHAQDLRRFFEDKYIELTFRIGIL